MKMSSKLVAPDYMQELLLISRQGANRLTRKLSRLINYPVIYTDPLFHIRSSSFTLENINLDEPLFIHYEKDSEPASIFHCQIVLNNKTFNGIASQIKITNKTLGFLIIFSENKQLNIEDYEPIISYTSSLYAFQLERKTELRHERFKLRKIFLFDLLYGNMRDETDIIDYGELWNWDFSLPHVVAVFTIKEFDYFTGDKQWIQSLLAVIEKTLISKNIKPITLTKQEEVIVILPTALEDAQMTKDFLTEITSLIFTNTEGTYLEDRVICGFGKVYKEATNIFRSYQEAKVASDIGLLLHIKVPFFIELGLEGILYKHDLQDLKEFFEHTLGELRKYDEENDTNLTEMLELLTFNQFDMTKTSQELFLHRNTLRYQLKKVEDILNCKLDDMNTRLNILAAFKVKRLKRL